jgi:aconitate hydratase
LAQSIVQKIISKHLTKGDLKAGEPIEIKIDQTLTQDATGTMAYLQFEAMGLPKVKTEVSVSYVDHNMLQSGYENADDHKFLQTIAKKYGIYFSKPGNGICHQVHLERFSVPSKTLLGSDSHTPTSGGVGMLAIGAGGLDVALAMAGVSFSLTMPKVINVELTGKLQPFVTAKDVILEVLRQLTVKGGVGAVVEYSGEGVKNLNIPERATICNMGAELGATSSVFPSDDITREFLKKQKRENIWTELKADENAIYDKIIKINLTELEPLLACPHSPDNIKKASELKNIKVDQVVVGSCTNSSVKDVLAMSHMLKNKKINTDVSAGFHPGSRQVLRTITKSGDLETLLSSGLRLLEVSCGACIGMGFSPNSKAVSLRTFNRNFEGRSGTKDAQVYLCSPELAIASAITGYITDPRTLGLPVFEFKEPEYTIDDSMIVSPVADGSKVEVIRGPNIKPLPVSSALEDKLNAKVSLKVGDNITTDDIMPAGSKILPLRSNIPAISEYVYINVDSGFAKRAKELKKSFIIGGTNYGQGSSREHAALAPMYLGVKSVIARQI